MVTYLPIIGRLVRVLRGLGVPALFGLVAGCHSGSLLWPCVLSKLYPVAAAGVLLWRKGSFMVLVCEGASGFCGVIGISLIEKKLR